MTHNIDRNGFASRYFFEDDYNKQGENDQYLDLCSEPGYDKMYYKDLIQKH